MKKTRLFRCSALGNITTLDRSTQITAIQTVELIELLSKIKITEKQAEKRDKLIAKRDAPPALSKGAKTHIKDIFFGEKFDFQKRFTNKFVQKGNEKETASMHALIKFLGLPMAVKNETHFSNDWIKGTPDLIFKALNFQVDTKNVFYPSGLDSFESEADRIYIEQAHGYNWLLGVDHGFVVKMLMNMPEHLLEKEAWILLKEAGLKTMTDDFMNEVRELYNFEAKPIEDRIKIFKVTTTPADIQRIKTSCELGNDYLEELESAWKVKNVENIEFIESLNLAV